MNAELRKLLEECARWAREPHFKLGKCMALASCPSTFWTRNFAITGADEGITCPAWKKRKKPTK